VTLLAKEHKLFRKHSLVTVYDSHIAAEEAIGQLRKNGFDMNKLSVLGTDSPPDNDVSGSPRNAVSGFYNTGERMEAWGVYGAFWGSLWGFLFGSAFIVLPELGPLAVAGPIVSLIVGAVEGALVVGGLSAVGAALHDIGIPRHSVLKYEAALKAGKFVVIVHGNSDEIARAKGLLEPSGTAESASPMEEHGGEV
jgi:hypothetical protein